MAGGVAFVKPKLRRLDSLEFARHKVSTALPVAVGFGLAVGFMFGIALERGQVYDPQVIRDQMTFTRFTMVRMFLSAVATGLLVVTALNSLRLVELHDHSPMWTRNALGAGILGIGMYLAGACPGTVFAQIGSGGANNSVYLFLGAVLGSWTFGRLEPYVRRLLPQRANNHGATVYGALGVSFAAVSLPLVAMIVAGLWSLEQYRPWQIDSGVPLSTAVGPAMLLAPVWSPHLAGFVIGLLQIPSFLIMHHGIGTSSAYVTIASHCAEPFDRLIRSREYFKDYMGSPKVMWQPALDMGIICGAFFSSRFSGRSEIDSSTSHWLALGCGFMLVFGARLANGCTSGHGLTGTAKLNIGSFIAACSMFGAAILTAQLASVMSR